MDKVRTLKPQATLPPEKAAEVALLRSITEKYITGECTGMLILWTDSDGLPEDSDFIGQISIPYLHMFLCKLLRGMEDGFFDDDDEDGPDA